MLRVGVDFMEKLEIFFAIFKTLSLVVYVILFIPLVKIEVKLLEKIHRKTKSFQTVGICGFILFAFITPIINFVALIRYHNKYGKLRDSIYKEVSKNPTTQGIDKLIDFVENYNLENKPQYWNQLRGVWFSINESSQVPTDKKRELRDFLTTKGLRLVGNDKNVIDNYKG